MFLKHHMVVSSEVQASLSVDLAGNDQVKQKSFEPGFKNCQMETFRIQELP